MKKPRNNKTAQQNPSKPKVTAAQRDGSSPALGNLKDVKGLNHETRRFNSAHGGTTPHEAARRAESANPDNPFSAEGGNKFFLASTFVQKKSVAAGMSDMLGSYTAFGIDPEQDNFDALDLMAQHIIDLLTANTYTFANLTRFERNILYRYFYKTNPVIGRIVDLHTDLPLSKVRLQSPADLPEIAKDYIMQFYERILARLNFAEFLRDLVLNHCIYGEAIGFVDDFYAHADNVLQDITALEEVVIEYSEEDQKQLEALEKKYDQDPKSVTVRERRDYIKLKFQNFFSQDYTGPDGLRIIPFYKIQEYLENDDIDFVGIKYILSESLNRLIEQNVGDDFLREVGYSSGMLALLQDTESAGQKTVVLDNDTLSGNPFIFRLRRPEGTSIILRIINEALEWEAAKRAMRAKIDSIGKIGRVVTAEGLSEGQTNALRQEVQLMLDDPGYAIVANFAVDWQEVNAELRDQLNELSTATDTITETIALGAGMPVSLIAGDTQYAGSSIKLEILNVEYHSFKQRVQSILEEKLFKPIALRKGFVTTDDWGNATLVYPRLTFSRVSLRDESVFDILFSLYQKGSLPVSVIMDILNLDPDDVKRGIEADMFTVNDPNFNELIRGLYTAVTDEISEQTDIASDIIDQLGLKRVDANLKNVTEDGVYNDDFGDFEHPKSPADTDKDKDDGDGKDDKDDNKNPNDPNQTDDKKPDPAPKPGDVPSFNDDKTKFKPRGPDDTGPADFDWGDK